MLSWGLHNKAQSCSNLVKLSRDPNRPLRFDTGICFKQTGLQVLLKAWMSELAIWHSPRCADF